MGIVLENKERSSTALAERTIGGRKSDIASEDATKFVSCTLFVSQYFYNRGIGTNLHDFIMMGV